MERGSGSRKDIKEAARALRARPGWDPTRQRVDTDEERVGAALQADRNRGVYAEADACAACAAARADTGDDSALCEEHLMAALG